MIAFVSNNGWVDGNAADGIRKTLADEFSDIWVYNLRGNQRTAGEISRREGGKVFGSGARTGVAVVIAVKREGATGPCNLRYFGVDDYLSREDKLERIDSATMAGVGWQAINPNESGDWLNQRGDSFERLVPLGLKDGSTAITVFARYSQGLNSGRDAWVYGFSQAAVSRNMQRAISFYNGEVARLEAKRSQGDNRTAADLLDNDKSKFNWNRSTRSDADRGRRYAWLQEAVRTGSYRPFTRHWVYFDRPLNDMVYQLEDLFPHRDQPNLGMWVSGTAASAPFLALATDLLPNLVLGGAGNPGQFFPRWTYERVAPGDQASLLESSGDVDEWGDRRVDNITDGILTLYRDTFGPRVAKDDVFFYVYGVLHSEQYRSTFAADLKRMLPRIPLAASTSDFDAFVEAGRKLSDLHVNYESVEPYPLAEQAPFSTDPWETFRVEKMRWADKTTKKAIVYNGHVTLGDIPAEAHRYMLGSRSALEWLIDRYQVKTDKDSGIVNDPNDWCREHGDPRYIVDLVKRITRVSVQTMMIVDSLPELPLA